MDKILAGALGQIRSVLPPGSSVSRDPPALAPRSRYWLAFPFPEAKKNWLLYPEDARLGRRVLDQIGYRHELAPDPGPAPRIIGVEIPPEAPWRMIGGAKDVAVILQNSSSKFILFCIERTGGEPIGVIKAAQQPATAKGLVREMGLLGELHRRGLRLSPRPLGRDGSSTTAPARRRLRRSSSPARGAPRIGPATSRLSSAGSTSCGSSGAPYRSGRWRSVSASASPRQAMRRRIGRRS